MNASAHQPLASPADSAQGPKYGGLFWGVWSAVAAFGAYSCMYAFRKPFTAAQFTDVTVYGFAFKSLLVTSQVAGYAVSKFIGIKVIAEMPAARRALTLVALVVLADVALLAFALIPPPWNALCLFFNGLPLGMVFGIVLGFLEGRRTTEALTAGLCASFILADGATKSLGSWLLSVGVSQFWMPCVAGSLMLVPLVLFVAMLVRIPPPDQADVAARCERSPLNKAERRALVLRYAGGLVPLVGMYLAITVLRSLRADFAPEIWRGLGETAAPATFTYSEIWVALGVTAANGLAMLVRDNRRAFFISLMICLGGALLLMGSIVGKRAGLCEGFTFMVLTGLGMYLPYVAVHTTVFERLLATTRERGNLGFLMYLADSIGYLGYVAVIVGHGLYHSPDNFIDFFVTACTVVSLLAAICVAFSWRYFAMKYPRPATVVVAATSG